MRSLPALTYGLLSLSLFCAATPRTAEAAPRETYVFVAMPGAGKTTVAKAVAVRAASVHKLMSAPRVYSSGDVIRDEVAVRYGTYTIENDKAMRAEFGKTPGRVGELVAAQVNKADGPVGIVEGFRTPEDLMAFKRAVPNVKVVAVEVGAARRYDRMLDRKRAGETSEKVLRERDASEVKLGVRRAMKLADVHIRPGDGEQALAHSVDLLMHKLDAAH